MKQEPIYMLNALWFKKDGGAEKYKEYVEAARPYLEEAGAEIDASYIPEQALIGDWDPDVFFVVKFPDLAAFEAMIGSEAYEGILHLRSEALEKSLLLRCKVPESQVS